MNLYDTNEYICKVMRLENCSREDALKLIEEFKKIDEQKEKVKMSLTEKDMYKAYRKKWTKEKKCQCCGKQDELTLAGSSRCGRCKEMQRQWYIRRKANGTERQNT